MFNSKIDRMSSRYMNAINDSGVGGLPVNTIGTAQALGQLGDIIYLTAAKAAAMSDSSVGTLYAGFYQYVQFKSGSTAANARGQLVFWSDMDNFIVTPDVTAGTMGLVAGVTLNVVTKGYYGWMQVGGKATVKCAAAVTDTTAGDLAIVTQTPANTVDGFADATAFATGKLAKSLLGTFIEAPANGGLKQVQLRFLGLPF